MKKHNNNTILYTDPEVAGMIQYGRVEAFVVLPQESLQLAIVQPLTVGSYDNVINLHIPEEMAHLASLCFTDFVTFTNDCRPRLPYQLNILSLNVFIPLQHTFQD